MTITIVDYGMGNLASVRRAFEECGADVHVSDDPKSCRTASKLVLPGVGAFAMAMDNIRQRGWYDALLEAAQQRQLPLLGICLGMQLLADTGFEDGETAGLGLVPGQVRRFQPENTDIRVPHVGWNEIAVKRDDALLTGLGDGTDFYFVHSYFFDASDPQDVLATTPYCGDFASIVGHGNVRGTQFHPEKSGVAGFQILRNFIAAA